jgi:hypothetical protein
VSAATLTLRRKSRAAFKCLRLGTLCTVVAFLYAPEASAQCAAKDVLQNAATPRIATVVAPSIDNVWKIWRKITLGQFANTFALRNALDAAGCGIGDLAEQILSRPSFALSAAKIDVDLVVVSGAELGTVTEPSLADIYAHTQAHGLALVPAEVGPLLRLEYLDQPIGEFLNVGMTPINTWAGEPVILTIANGGAGLILIGKDGSPNAKMSAMSRFLFVRPRVLAEEP